MSILRKIYIGFLVYLFFGTLAYLWADRDTNAVIFTVLGGIVAIGYWIETNVESARHHAEFIDRDIYYNTDDVEIYDWAQEEEQ